MGNESQQRSSAAGPVIAIIAVVALLLFGVLAAFGMGAWLLLRTEARQAEVLLVEAEQAHDMADQQWAEAMEAVPETPESPVLQRASAREIVVRLDREGRITADGRSLELDELKTLLQEAADDSEASVAVHLRVDEQCPFRRVAEVQSLCGELSLHDVTMAVSEDEGEGETISNKP